MKTDRVLLNPLDNFISRFVAGASTTQLELAEVSEGDVPGCCVWTRVSGLDLRLF